MSVEYAHGFYIGWALTPEQVAQIDPVRSALSAVGAYIIDAGNAWTGEPETYLSIVPQDYPPEEVTRLFSYADRADLVREKAAMYGITLDQPRIGSYLSIF